MQWCDKNEINKAPLSLKKQTVVNVYTCNKLLKAGQFPFSWREGVIVTIINKKMREYQITWEITLFLAREQGGHRKTLRTGDKIFILNTIVNIHIQKKGSEKIFACFVDLNKAFDTVWYDDLLLNLQRTGIHVKVYELLVSIYGGSVSQVKCKNILTDPMNVTRSSPR